MHSPLLTSVAGALLRTGDPASTALIDGDNTITRGALIERIADRRAEFRLADRSVVVLSGTNSLEFVVTYLALLDAGHVPLLAGSRRDRLIDAWSPTLDIDVDGDKVEIVRHDVDPVPLHPDLALLMSTSGSTGNPKLVRLSHRNVISNATAISEYLRLTDRDRGITSLPLHYCYGLSVLHSHLIVGASVVLTDTSVVDPCFRAALATNDVTNIAGVPHTFELLDRVDPEWIRVPSLRFVTQAGGKLGATGVERWLHRTKSWDVDFYVMYGQTEATARMAYLPLEIAERRPAAIGVAIPGGELRLAPVAGEADGVGELVYSGPNVMMGYAVAPDDLASPAELAELRTGDLARYHADDEVFEVVGRRSRFVKPFGLRIDLDGLERELAASCDQIAVAGDDQRIVVAAPGGDSHHVAHLVVASTGLPKHLVFVDVDDSIPRTVSGKVDYAAITKTERPGESTMAATCETGAECETETGRGTSPASTVAAVYASVLGHSDIGPDDSFVSLGGDSLSYVECSIRLEAALGRLPDGWHLRPIAEFAAAAPPSRLARLDTTALLRAVGILAVVATHMRLYRFPGGAHLLLAVAGYNVGRFLLPIASTSGRVRAGLRTAGRAALPTIAWITAGMVLFGTYSLGTVLLVNNYAGPPHHGADYWHFWFIEVYVHLAIVVTAVFAIPAVHRFDQRHRYWLPLAVAVASLSLRLDWAQMDDWYNMRYRTHAIAWFFVLGWLVQRSNTVRQRMMTTVLCVAVVPGFFDRPQREWFIIAGLVALTWWRELPVPRAVVRPIGVLAAASMWIYLTHFSIWPPVARAYPTFVAYAITVAAGVIVWAAVTYIPRSIPHYWARLVGWRTVRRSLTSPYRGSGRVSPPTPSPTPSGVSQ